MAEPASLRWNTQWAVQTAEHSSAGLIECAQWGSLGGRVWTVVTLWELLRGRPEVVQIRVLAADEGLVTPEVLRRLPLGEMFKYARSRFHGASSGLMAGVPGSPGDENVIRQFDRAITGAHRGIAATPDELGEIAAVYREAWETGRLVKRAVAKHFNISESTANKRIIKARAAGLLEGVGRTQ